jgi:diguanylate cyclase (GGDEF)-like protein/PAS domain S-box-containing protein
MSEALLVVDGDGRVSLANQAACRLFGYSERGLHHKKLRKLLCPESASVGELLAPRSESAPLETRILTRLDGRIPVLWSASPLPDGESTVCLAQDLRVRKLAYFDSVTDLPNRVQFKQELARAVGEAHQERTSLAVLFVDLDHFKMVNDSYGHDVGDRLLRGVADRLQKVLQQDPIAGRCSQPPMLARLGGDEFTILVHGMANNAQVADMADKLLTALRDPFELGERQVLVAASIGIALFPEHGDEPETLIQNSDRAMYWAKERGRNAARFFEPTMENAANQRLELENELRRAVQSNGLSVYYQPQVDIASGRVVGCEALLRWHHPQLGSISPGLFIPIAETSGLIIPLDRWVIETACEQLLRWGRQGLGELRIAVNVTALTLQQEDFVDFVLGTLGAAGVAPHKLEIEITERAAVVDLCATVAKLEQLRQAGVQIAIDDFGTGYSSLSYLKRLPADRLKIDRSFVCEAHLDPTDRALFRAIVDMAGAVGMEIVAEGVETQQQLDFLRTEGCQNYQGFYMSPAIAADDVLPWLLERDLAPQSAETKRVRRAVSAPSPAPRPQPTRHADEAAKALVEA